MLSTYVSFEAINRNLTQSLANTAKNTAVSNSTTYYLANIGKVKSVSDLVNNYRLFSYAMKAYGLEDFTYAKGMMSQSLSGGVSNANSLANKLTDPRYKAIAAAFSYLSDGSSTSSPPTSATTDTVSKFYEQSLEDNAGQQSTGVQLALYFQRMAPTIKDAYSVLADKALLKVVQTVLNIPASSSTQDLSVQAQNITAKLNFKDLQDPTKVQALIKRFTAMYDMQNPSTSTTANAVLLIGQSTQGLSGDLLASLQGLKLGGA